MTPGIKLTIGYDSDIQLPDIDKIIDLALVTTANYLHSEIQSEAPVDTGRLVDGWTTTKTGHHEYSVSTDVEYARWVNDGTGIYGPRGQRITPKNATVLRFTPRGANKPVFVRSIAGQKPNPYIDRAITRTQIAADSVIDSAFTVAGI